jgi:hypothetical protein
LFQDEKHYFAQLVGVCDANRTFAMAFANWKNSDLRQIFAVSVRQIGVKEKKMKFQHWFVFLLAGFIVMTQATLSHTI